DRGHLARRFHARVYKRRNKKSKPRLLKPRLPPHRRLVGEDTNGSSRRKTGGGERLVVGKNARENFPPARARYDEEDFPARFQRRIGERDARFGLCANDRCDPGIALAERLGVWEQRGGVTVLPKAEQG